MKKKLFCVFTAIFLMLIMLVIIGCKDERKNNHDKNVLNIGVLLPLSGQLSLEGEKCYAAVRLAEEEINNSNKYPFSIKLIIEDSKFTSKDSLLALNKILLTDDIVALISFGTPPTQAVKGRIDTLKIPMLALDGTSGLAEGSQWIFECFPQFKDVGFAAGNFAKQLNKENPIGLLTMNSSGGDDFAKGFLTGADADIVREIFDANSLDVKAQISKIVSMSPKIICIFGYGTGYTTAVNQLLQSGYNGTIITDSNITSIKSKLKNSEREIFFVSHNYGTFTNNIQSITYIDEINKKFNIEASVFSAHVYEMVKMIADSAQTVNIVSPENIKNNLANMQSYQSMFGKISFSKHGNIMIPFIIVKMQGNSLIVTD